MYKLFVKRNGVFVEQGLYISHATAQAAGVLMVARRNVQDFRVGLATRLYPLKPYRVKERSVA